MGNDKYSGSQFAVVEVKKIDITPEILDRIHKYYSSQKVTETHLTDFYTGILTYRNAEGKTITEEKTWKEACEIRDQINLNTTREIDL